MLQVPSWVWGRGAMAQPEQLEALGCLSSEQRLKGFLRKRVAEGLEERVKLKKKASLAN